MAKQKKITELPLAGSTKGLVTIGVDNTNKSVKVDIEALKAETINGTPSIRYDVAQNLTNGQKAQAKANMDVDATIATHNNSQSAHGNIVVKTIPQTLTAAQKEQARTNIGASTGGSGDIDTAIAAHNASNDFSTHPDFISRGRRGKHGSPNTYTAAEIENMGDNLGHSAYGYNFTAMMQIGLQRVNTALRLQAIITKFGGTDTKMPGYYGFSLRNGSGGDALQDPNDQYIPGFFCFSLNEEANKAAFPMKIVIYDGSGARKAYFKSGTTPTLTAWQDIKTIEGYREDWTSPDDATIPYGETAESIYEWGFIKDGNASYDNAYQLLHFAYGQGYPAYVSTARQTRIWTNGVIETREKPPFNAWGEWQPVGGGSVPATTTQAGVVTLASNTGNSTDAGKVLALDANGRMPRAAEKRGTFSLTSGQTLNISEYPDLDVFVLVYTTASTYPPIVNLPSTADARSRIKFRLQLTSTGSSSPAVVVMRESNGTSTNFQANPNTTKTAFVVAEQFDANNFMIVTKIEK